MTKYLAGTIATIFASPAFAHVSETPIHTHGYEAPAIAVALIAIAGLVWRFGKSAQ